MTRAALWLRVSTGEQQAENQLPDLQAWAARHGWEMVKITRPRSRPGLDKFDIPLVWALDRLSREGVAATLEII